MSAVAITLNLEVLVLVYTEIIKYIDQIVSNNFNLFISNIRKNSKFESKWNCTNFLDIVNKIEIMNKFIPNEEARKDLVYFVINRKNPKYPTWLSLDKYSLEPVETHISRKITQICKDNNCKLISIDWVANDKNFFLYFTVVKSAFSNTQFEVEELKKELEKVKSAYSLLEMQVGLINQVMKRRIPNYEQEYMTMFK